MSSRYHHYGPCYADLLNRMRPSWLARDSSQLVIGEIGILKGTGLAIWSEIFPGAQIYGFDFQLNNTINNLLFLKSKGAFVHGDPLLTAYDQLRPVADNAQMLRDVLGAKRISFFMDDGLHTAKAIIDTFLAFKDFVLLGGLYVVEDVSIPKSEKAAFRKVKYPLRQYAFATFEPVVKKFGWSMHSCTSDARWYAFLPPEEALPARGNNVTP